MSGSTTLQDLSSVWIRLCIAAPVLYDGARESSLLGGVGVDQARISTDARNYKAGSGLLATSNIDLSSTA